MADAKARAAARRQAILAGKSDRLAKLTTKAKNDGDPAGNVREAADGVYCFFFSVLLAYNDHQTHRWQTYHHMIAHTIQGVSFARAKLLSVKAQAVFDQVLDQRTRYRIARIPLD